MISSIDNIKIKEIVKLRKANKRRKSELIVIEGQKEIEMAMRRGIEIHELFYCSVFGKEGMRGVENTEVSKKVFRKISFRENPDGYLALAKPIETAFSDIKIKKGLILVLHSLEKPGNMGAILRTADAAQVDAVVLSDTKIDIFNPNVIRASLGAVFAVPIVIASREGVLSWLREKDLKIYIADDQGVRNYYEVDFNKSVAIVIGAEHEGVSEFWKKAADETVKIPMNGLVDSLNASVSAGIIIYDVVRQKNLK